MDPQGLELAKEGLKESFKTAKEFAGKLVSPALEEGGGIIQDNLKLWRLKNQINILLKAKKFLEDKGIDPKKVLPKTLISILENGSLDEEEEMQNKWAALLANAASSNHNTKQSFAKILNELSPLEARLLDKLFEEASKETGKKRFELNFSKDKIMEVFGISSDEFDIIADNLFRLNLCQAPASHGGVSIGEFPIVLRTYKFISFTPLGYSFVKTCRFD